MGGPKSNLYKSYRSEAINLRSGEINLAEKSKRKEGQTQTYRGAGTDTFIRRRCRKSSFQSRRRIVILLAQGPRDVNASRVPKQNFFLVGAQTRLGVGDCIS